MCICDAFWGLRVGFRSVVGFMTLFFTLITYFHTWQGILALALRFTSYSFANTLGCSHVNKFFVCTNWMVKKSLKLGEGRHGMIKTKNKSYKIVNFYAGCFGDSIFHGYTLCFSGQKNVGISRTSYFKPILIFSVTLFNKNIMYV